MQKYSNSVQDTAGNAIEAASVSVYDQGTTNLSTIYSDDAATVTTNPQITDSKGEFSFYAANGRYDIQVTKTGVATQDLKDVLLYDPGDGTSGFTATVSLNSTDYVPVDQAGVGKKSLLSTLADWIVQTYASFTQSGIGAVAEDVQSVLKYQSISVMSFIPAALRASVVDGSNTTDLGPYILKAVNAAAMAQAYAGTPNKGELYFPPGVYYINTDACLTPTVSTSIYGLKFRGAGMYTSVLRLNGSALSDLWFYNSATSSVGLFFSFEDIGFEGRSPSGFTGYSDIPSHSKGFHLYGPSEQGFRFDRCRLEYLDTMFDFEGTNNASEMFFFGCRLSQCKTQVYLINNVQSFNHEFHSCDVVNIYGNVFVQSSSTGGAIKMYGGSVIMLDAGTSTDVYFLSASGSFDQSSRPVVFDGVRLETRGNYTNLLSLATAKNSIVSFRSCNLYDEATADKTKWASLGVYSEVHFDDCSIENTGGFTLQHNLIGAWASTYNLGGMYVFTRCGLPSSFSTYFSSTNGAGSAHAIDCLPNTGTTLSNGAHEAYDFDLNFTPSAAGQASGGGWTGTDFNPGSGRMQWRLKTASMKQNDEYFPGPTGIAEPTLLLPKNAIIKAIHLRKGAAGTDGTSVTLSIGDNTKGTTHLTSNTDVWKNYLYADVNDYFYSVGTATDDRTLRMWNSTTSGLQFQNSGMAIVEYY